MKKAYVLYCSVWGGNSYETELTCIYLNYNSADKRAKELQGNYCTSDVEYRVEEVNIEDFDWETELEAHQAWQQEKLRYIKSIVSTDLDYLGVDVIEALSKYATKLENDIANKLISLRSWPHELLEECGNLPQRYRDIPMEKFV